MFRISEGKIGSHTILHPYFGIAWSAAGQLVDFQPSLKTCCSSHHWLLEQMWPDFEVGSLRKAKGCITPSGLPCRPNANLEFLRVQTTCLEPSTNFFCFNTKPAKAFINGICCTYVCVWQCVQCYCLLALMSCNSHHHIHIQSWFPISHENLSDHVKPFNPWQHRNDDDDLKLNRDVYL